jgi:hypothetical protein
MRRIEKPGLRGMAVVGAVLTALALLIGGCSRSPKEPVADTAAAELAAAEAARQEAVAAELAAAEAARQEAAAAELAAAEAARQEAAAAEAARQKAVAAEAARQKAAAAELAAAEAARREAAAAELAAAEAARQEAAAAELAAAEVAAAELAAVKATVAETALPTYPGPGKSVEPGENIGSEVSGVQKDVVITTQPAIAGSSGLLADGGRRFSLGLLNLALGAGSFVQKDWGGGLAVLAGYALAGGLIAWELTLIYEDPLAGIPGAVGLGVAASAAIFGFIRPFFFNRSRPEAIQTKRVNLSFVSGDRGAAGVRVSYILQY